MLKYVLVGALVVVLIVSSYFGFYYYNSSKALTRRIQGATLEAARGFDHSLDYATEILEALASEANESRVFDLIQYFRWYIYSAIRFLSAFRAYLLPSYEDSLQVVENLLWNMSAGGWGGVSDTLDHLLGTNLSTMTAAFKELNQVASEKIREMGFELAEAFESLRRDHTVQTFKIDPTRLENVVLIANDLKTILNEWVTKYSQI